MGGLQMGDPTAYSMGRVTLNPLAHIDPIGTILLPLLLVLIKAPAFGWAKPVIVNPYNLKNPRRDNLWISLAGPAANFTAAAAALITIVLLKLASPGITTFLRSFLVYKQAAPRGIYPAGRPGPDSLLRGSDQHLPGRFQPHPHPAARRQRGPDRASVRRGRPPVRPDPAFRLHHRPPSDLRGFPGHHYQAPPAIYLHPHLLLT